MRFVATVCVVAFQCLAALGCGGHATAQSTGVCQAGELAVRRPCGACGTQTATCASGLVSEFGPCVEPSLCGDAGVRDGGGDDGGSAGSGGDSGKCTDGAIDLQACGNCGRRSRTCDGGVWSETSPCEAEGECAPGEVGTAACGTDVGACAAGTKTRACSAFCSWGAWEACGGAYVGSMPESCGNALDDDCNGLVDEGCACSPVAVGASGSLPLAGHIKKLVADPNRCFIYALNGGSPSQVVVLDTISKAETTRITLPSVATDIDISPNGDYLVVALDEAHQLSVVDTVLLQVKASVETASDPQVLEVDDAGVVHYAERDQSTGLRAIDLAVGLASDQFTNIGMSMEGDIELSAGADAIYVGSSGYSEGVLSKDSLVGGQSMSWGTSLWHDNPDYSDLPRHVYLSPSGRHVYYAKHQIETSRLRCTGRTGELVFAEDAASTFAVGEHNVFDAALLRPVAKLPETATAASLTSADKELWYFSAPTGRVYYQNTAEFVVGAELGQRNRTPQPIESYAIEKLAHDPVRHRLYGLDPTHDCLLVMDAQTLQPTLEIVVGNLPTSLSVDGTGDYLYVGHLGIQALARIELSTPSFDAFVETTLPQYDVETLSGTRVALAVKDSAIVVVDGLTGVEQYGVVNLMRPDLSASADKSILYAGEVYLSEAKVKKYTVTGTALQETDGFADTTSYGTFPAAILQTTAIPDGTGAFYGNWRFSSAWMSVVNDPVTDPIVVVTPDSRLAISANKVYAVATGELVGTLPFTSLVQAASPDSKTLYAVYAGQLQTADLTSY